MTVLAAATNLVDAGLLAQLLLGALAVVAAVVTRGRLRNLLAGALIVAAGIAAAVTGSAALLG